MAIAMAGVTPAVGQTILVKNSAGAVHDSCTLKVSQQASNVMSLMDFDDLKIHCSRLDEAARNVKLKSSMKVERKEKKP